MQRVGMTSSALRVISKAQLPLWFSNSAVQGTKGVFWLLVNGGVLLTGGHGAARLFLMRDPN